jgi:Na+-transporting methylmalonyl-CoA/oxaloacetate decarboxylase gamma subunit
MGQPVTSDPILIAVINMTVVFAVLYGLSLMIRLITLLDPTQKKKAIVIEETVEQVSVDTDRVSNAQEEHDEMMILFAAAIAAYGHSEARIVAIRPMGNTTWSQTARVESIHTRKSMF